MTEHTDWTRVETEDSEIYEVLSPDPINPEYPERYRLDVVRDGTASHVLTKDQPGPWIFADTPIEMFVALTDLVRLGKLAQTLLDDGVPDD